jgi:hypothetical protein
LWLQAPYAKAYILRYSMHATHIIVFISHYSVPYTPKQHGSMDQYTSQKNSKTKTTFVWGSGTSFYTYTKKIDFVIKWSHAIAYSWRILQIGFSGLDSPDWILQIGFSSLERKNTWISPKSIFPKSRMSCHLTLSYGASAPDNISYTKTFQCTCTRMCVVLRRLTLSCGVSAPDVLSRCISAR